jgi:cytosine/adenosine deaminase-related metal-dependent hydrolase
MTDIVLGPDSTGAVLVASGGTITHFGAHPPQSIAGAIDCRDGVIVPGAVNAHTHLYSGLVPLGMPAPQPEPRNFIEILEQIWWRLDRALDAESLRASARLYAAEALLAGTTVLIDHHESPNLIEGSLDIVGDACEEIGIRALVCYGATERNDGVSEALSGLGECRRFISANRRTLVRGAVGLHASFTVSDETIREAGELCRATGAPLHVHVAEDGADVDDARRRGYEGCLQRLHRLRALEPRSILAHGVHLSEDEVKTAERLRLWLVQNPRSNRGNRVGYPASLRASSDVALGTDGYPADMRAEAAALREEASRAGELAETVNARVMDGHRLAAEIFGLDFAPLVAGAAADAVVISDDRVRHAVVAGRLVVKNGELLTADISKIRQEAAREATRLWERMRATPVRRWKRDEVAMST